MTAFGDATSLSGSSIGNWVIGILIIHDINILGKGMATYGSPIRWTSFLQVSEENFREGCVLAINVCLTQLLPL
jgi:hypothetical protein